MLFDDFSPAGQLVAGIALMAATPLVSLAVIPLAATAGAVAVTAGTMTTAAAIASGTTAATTAAGAAATLGVAVVHEGTKRLSE